MSEYQSGSVVVAKVGTELKRALVERARSHDRTVSAELRRVLRAHLATETEKENRP